VRYDKSTLQSCTDWTSCSELANTVSNDLELSLIREQTAVPWDRRKSGRYKQGKLLLRMSFYLGLLGPQVVQTHQSQSDVDRGAMWSLRQTRSDSIRTLSGEKRCLWWF
jgi:hypothetical protein